MFITDGYTQQDMAKQGKGARSDVSKTRDAAVVDSSTIRITVVVQRALKTGAFRNSLAMGNI